MENAVHWGAAYLLAIQLHQREQLPPVQIAATIKTTADVGVSRLVEVLEQLVAGLGCPHLPETQRPRTTLQRRPATRGSRGQRGHTQKSAGAQYLRPASVSTPRRPNTRGRDRRPFSQTRRNLPKEWQISKRTSRPKKRPGTFTLPLTNHFDQLPEPEMTNGSHSEAEEEPPTHRRPSHGHKKPRPPQAKKKAISSTENEHAGEVWVQPHGDSYFLPGKVAGKAVTFLLDSGFTTNLLRRRVFDTLPLKDRERMGPYDGEHGTLANGSCIPFYGIIKLTGRVQDQNIQKTFLVSQLAEDGILGMSFLKWHGCHIDFSNSALVMSGRELACVDKYGCPLVGGVQVVWDSTIPGHSGATVSCKVNNSRISGLG